jgi:hypothetical protein
MTLSLSRKRKDGTFPRDDFNCDLAGDVYFCPGGKALTTTGTRVSPGTTQVLIVHQTELVPTRRQHRSCFQSQKLKAQIRFSKMAPRQISNTKCLHRRMRRQRQSPNRHPGRLIWLTKRHERTPQSVKFARQHLNQRPLFPRLRLLPIGTPQQQLRGSGSSDL